MTNFAFLPSQFRTIAESATRAEGYINSDPRTACFHSRFALEALVHWLYRHERSLHMPYDNKLSALLHEPSFQNLVPQVLFHKAKLIKNIGNDAVHNPRPIHQKTPSKPSKNSTTFATGSPAPTPPTHPAMVQLGMTTASPPR
nr:DUF4145 domain-containing protein [Acaryochloris sp. CCMEE 5410]